MEVILSIVRR